MNFETLLPQIITGLFVIAGSYLTTRSQLEQYKRGGQAKDQGDAASKFIDVAKRTAELNTGLQEQNAALIAERALSQEVIAQIQGKLADLERDNENWEQRNDGLIKRVAALSTNYDGVSRRMEELARTVAQRDETIAELRREISRKDAQISRLFELLNTYRKRAGEPALVLETI